MERLTGTVRSGIGDFAQWIETLADHYERKTGLRLFSGTLNLELDAPYALPPDCVRLEAHEYGGRVSVNIVPCTVFGRRAVILRTDRNESGTGRHPKTILEIATDAKLRDAYGLRDGDRVTVEIPGETKS